MADRMCKSLLKPWKFLRARRAKMESEAKPTTARPQALNILSLPVELQTQILSYLTLVDLARATTAFKPWSTIITQNHSFINDVYGNRVQILISNFKCLEFLVEEHQPVKYLFTEIFRPTLLYAHTYRGTSQDVTECPLFDAPLLRDRRGDGEVTIAIDRASQYENNVAVGYDLVGHITLPRTATVRNFVHDVILLLRGRSMASPSRLRWPTRYQYRVEEGYCLFIHGFFALPWIPASYGPETEYRACFGIKHLDPLGMIETIELES
ncbi:hypothetical protein TWF694_005327 [Orbilia ellipsospora]|uniref:F-box domain-containing protein n=1 Tax=Orbilia ellipsospora TaxID=2528407 RepID=A0AAV9WU02_9PEZI